MKTIFLLSVLLLSVNFSHAQSQTNRTNEITREEAVKIAEKFIIENK